MISSCCGYINPFSHINAFRHLCSRRLMKTLWQKKKLLKMSNFSFRHNAFSVIIPSFIGAFCVFPWRFSKSSAADLLYVGNGKWSILYSGRRTTPIRKYLNIRFNPFSHIDAFWSAAKNFWKHCGKRRNCSKQTISPFVTMFSTLFNHYINIYGQFS